MAAPFSILVFVRSCMACRFIQNSGLVSKKRARRNAVSAVTERSPFTMAPMRVAGTRKAIASALIDIPRGLRNSSFKHLAGMGGHPVGSCNSFSGSRRFRHRRALPQSR